MNILARITNRAGEHAVTVETGDRRQAVAIAAKAEGPGSSVNGGELLFLAMATCYCNDIYREARKRAIEVVKVEVEVSGAFGGEGNRRALSAIARPSMPGPPARPFIN